MAVRFAVAFFVLWTCLLVSEARAQLDPVMFYSGRLDDRDGFPVTGERRMSFAIYESEQANEAIWEESWDVVPVENGEFFVYLGALAPFAPSTFDGPERYLGVTVEDGDELRPRLRLSAAPVAVHSLMAVESQRSAVCEDANTVGGHSPDDFATSDHHHDGRYLAAADRQCPNGQAMTGSLANGDPLCTALPQAIGEQQVDQWVANNGYQRSLRGECLPDEILQSILPDGSLVCLSLSLTGADEAQVDTWVSNNGFQRRVVGACPPGEAIRVVAADGSATCEPVGFGDGVSLDAPGGNINVVQVDGEGHVGIGTETPEAQLDVVGDVRVSDLSGNGVRLVTADAQGVLGVARPIDVAGLVTLTNANMLSVELPSNTPVRIAETIRFAADFDRLRNTSRVTLVGGGLVGVNGQVLRLGDYSVVQGARIENLAIEGNWISFVNCTFVGAVSLPFEASVQGGTVENAMFGVGRLGTFTGVRISGSTIPTAHGFVGCRIDDSTIGSAATTVGGIVGSQLLDDTRVVFAGSNSKFVGNTCSDTYVEITSSAGAGITIQGNYFDGIYPNATETILVDGAEGNFRSYIIDGNSFFVPNATPQTIRIVGQANGFYQMLRISNNTFIRGTAAISYAGTMRTLVQNNLLRNTFIGVAQSVTLVEQNSVRMD